MKAVVLHNDDYLYAKCCFHRADLLFRNGRADQAFAEYEVSLSHFRRVLAGAEREAEEDEDLEDMLPLIEVSLATALRDFSQCVYLRGSKSNPPSPTPSPGTLSPAASSSEGKIDLVYHYI